MKVYACNAAYRETQIRQDVVSGCDKKNVNYLSYICGQPLLARWQLRTHLIYTCVLEFSAERGKSMIAVLPALS